DSRKAGIPRRHAETAGAAGCISYRFGVRMMAVAQETYRQTTDGPRRQEVRDPESLRLRPYHRAPGRRAAPPPTSPATSRRPSQPGKPDPRAVRAAGQSGHSRGRPHRAVQLGTGLVGRPAAGEEPCSGTRRCSEELETEAGPDPETVRRRGGYRTR